MGGRFPTCRRCDSGELLPLSDYSPMGAGLPYKAWVCTNPVCGFNLTIRNGALVVDKPITSRTRGALPPRPPHTEWPLPRIPLQSPMQTPAYRVGAAYDAVQTFPPTDQSTFRYRQGQFELALCFTSPRSAEVRDVGKGLARFALFIEAGVVVLLTAFGDSIAWGPSPLLLGPCEQVEPALPRAPSGGARDRIVVLLVEAGSRLVRAVRDVPLTVAIAQVLRQGVQQAALLAEAGAYERALAQLEERYPTDADLVEHAVLHWSDEGETGGKPWRR